MFYLVPFTGLRPIFRILVATLFGFLIAFIIRLYKVRQRTHEFQKLGLSMPPFNMVFGHLLAMSKMISELPGDATPQYFPYYLRQKFPNLGSVFYLDNWPFSPPILAVASPTILHQITQEPSLPKHHFMRKFIGPIAGEHSILTSEGQTWKKWRSICSPSFSTAHLVAQLPDILEAITIFHDILHRHTLNQRRNPFQLKALTDSLVADILGKISLNTSLQSQLKKHPMVIAVRRQIPWLLFGEGWNPLRPLVHWYNSRVVDGYVSEIFEARFRLHQDVYKTQAVRDSKCLVDLFIKNYLADETSNIYVMDPAFKSAAMDQLKLFLFAGQDTTSSTICYVFYNVSQNPSVLAHLRSEYNNTFTPDLTRAEDLLAEQPHLLNRLPYTLAVIKETLRLFPTLSSTRTGDAGTFLVGDDGLRYPTEGCIVWSVHHSIHRDNSFWSDPDAFIPERWLVPSEHPLYPVRGAWRPFELGPRQCIGQELAIMIIKIVMVLTLRDLKISSAYDEWDRMKTVKGLRTVGSERAYQAWNGTPNAGFPCKVEIEMTGRET